MPSERSFARLPGFRDFAPEDLAIRQHVFDAWRRVAQRYGFQEYDGPPLESLDLYVEKSGEEIVGQLYNFEDKGGRQVAMRPEATPTLARILAERSKGMAKPIRWFTVPQLFRYERQQRGRLREHFQWNCDIVGEGSCAADAEVLAVAVDALRLLGLTAEDFHARVNDRRLVTAVLRAMDIPDDLHMTCLGVADKLGRTAPEKAKGRLLEAGLDEDLAHKLLELFQSASLEGIDARFGEHAEVAAALTELRVYLSTLEAMGLGDYVDFDFTIVRGLAYYTGIVFELFDRRGELRAICGGGRYDRLLELVGGEPLPAVGFGMGDVVLTELLKDRDLLPDPAPYVEYVMIWVSDTEEAPALGLAHELRDAGASVVYELRSRGVGKKLQAASKIGAQKALILGPEELASGEVTVRDMATGEETRISREALVTETASRG